MGIGTLLGYLIGSRTAILALANHPRTRLIGLVFVLSAGFAREYDGEDLLHEPWYLAIPLIASLVSSFVLFLVLYLPSWLTGSDAPPFFPAYRAFLGVFWMTAPLAWLYAVPYERLFDPVSAVHANIRTLTLVSIWRVALMVRVGVVLFGLSPWAAMFRVLAFADSVALIVLNFLPFPIIEIMGGVRVSESDMAVRSAAAFVACWGGCTFIVWWVLAISAGNRNSWALSRCKDGDTDKAGTIRSISGALARPVTWPMRLLAVSSLAVWIPILPFTQPEQQLRRIVEAAFRQGRHDDGLRVLSAHELEDFPPQWEPPPHFLKGDRTEMVLEICEEMLRNDPAPWVRQHYFERFSAFVEISSSRWHDEKVAKLLNQMPEGEVLLRAWTGKPNMHFVLERLDSHLRPELRATKRKAD